ncbi:unnamed protein product [Sphenostylis stenocarpa]|uniref:Uncharacterized protein n=1 Tax=Sphenostylis stenocarpa TaxID=92480 RepID=A0AA86SEE6_9FABA|nr:unnamed protein product [Sphenostylis stenocarpa]
MPDDDLPLAWIGILKVSVTLKQKWCLMYNCNSLEGQDNGKDRMNVSHGRVKGNDGDRFGTTQIDRFQLLCCANASNTGHGLLI